MIHWLQAAWKGLLIWLQAAVVISFEAKPTSLLVAILANRMAEGPVA